MTGRAVATLLALLATAPGRAQDAPQAPPAPAPAPAPPAWLPRAGADLVALDKVSAKATPLSIAVGQSAGYGTLAIAVRACAVRPPDQPADATAWLDVTDSTPDAPQFHGWIIRSAPAASGLQHPLYDLRLSGCH